MKLLTIILASYLIVLSLLPCSDKRNVAVSGKENRKISVLVNYQRDHHKTDNCTPFCHCSCCSTTVLFQTVAVVNAHEWKTSIQKVYFVESFVSHDEKSIWQPPQLS